MRDLAAGQTTLAGRKATGEPLDGGVGTVALSNDGGCLAMTLQGGEIYASGPIVSPNLPGSVPSPDFQTVVTRALKPTCAPTPPVPGPGPGGKDTTAPVISRVSVTNKRFRVGTKRTAVSAAARRRAKVGTTVRFTLSEAATVTIRFERQRAGRKVGRTCRRATPKLRRHKRCTRYESRGTLTRKGLPAGARRIAFSGRIGRRALPPGAYRVTLRAVDAAGNRSAERRVRVTVVR